MNSPSSTRRRVLDQTEQKWLQDKWHKIDKSGDGVLDLHELGVFLETLRRGISQEDKELAFKDIDADGQGAVEVCALSACSRPLLRFAAFVWALVCLD